MTLPACSYNEAVREVVSRFLLIPGLKIRLKKISTASVVLSAVYGEDWTKVYADLLEEMNKKER